MCSWNKQPRSLNGVSYGLCAEPTRGLRTREMVPFVVKTDSSKRHAALATDINSLKFVNLFRADFDTTFEHVPIVAAAAFTCRMGGWITLLHSPFNSCLGNWLAGGSKRPHSSNCDFNSWLLSGGSADILRRDCAIKLRGRKKAL